jgi:polyisoprenoid-binding protein YceI
MKKFIASIIALSTITAFGQTYSVDSSASKITYVGKKVTGEHTGTLTLKSGSLTFKGDTISAGEFVADMNSLTSTDITDKEYNAKYVSHMKSPDFFNTEKHPESKLVIKSSKKTKNGLEVSGDLTMLGETKPVSFVVTDLKKTDAGVTGKSNLTLNRTQWGLKYGSTSFFKGLGDKAIHDDFTLAVELSAKASTAKQ